MRFFSVLFLVLVSISLVSSFAICVDQDPPSPPANLTLSSVNGGINLSWPEAVDTPNCSGIAYYSIYKNGVFLNVTTETFYFDAGLADGTYTYVIHATDLVGRNEGNGVSNSLTLSSGGTSSGGGGGSSGGSSTYWECGEWGDCINGTQVRVCSELGERFDDRTESKPCIVDFTPLSYNDSGVSFDGAGNVNLDDGNGNSITGSVVGFAKSGTGIVTLIVVVFLGAAGVSIRFIRLRK